MPKSEKSQTTGKQKHQIKPMTNNHEKNGCSKAVDERAQATANRIKSGGKKNGTSKNSDIARSEMIHAGKNPEENKASI